MLILAGLTTSAGGQEGRPPFDQSGKGAVLCVWSIYVGIEQGIDLCEMAPMAGDEHLAPSIRRMEDFILEHTTQGISQAVLDDYKSRVYEQTRQLMGSQSKAMCEDVRMMRELLVGNLVAATDDVLSVPREPLWNPCI